MTPPVSVRTLVCALLIVMAAAFLHHEVLWGRMVYHMDDAADGYYPSHVAALRAIGDGELPTWERGAWSGWPLLANPYYAFFYPATAVFDVLGPVRGLGVVVFLHVLLAAAGMFTLVRRRGVGRGGALLAAVSLAFSSFMAVRIRHIIFPQFVAWIPVLLAAIEGWFHAHRRRDLVLVAIASAMLLLSGGTPLVPYLLILVAAYLLPRAVQIRSLAELRPWGVLALAAAIGTLIAMAQLVPTFAHLPYSPRSLGVDYAFASTYAWPGMKYAATLAAPEMLGTERAWFGVYNHWEMAGWYSGALVLCLAPLGLARRERPERWALAAAVLLAVGLAFGDAAPFHRLFFRFVPLYGTLRDPTRALVIALVALPLLAADGLTWLGRIAARQRRPRAGDAAIIIGAIALLAWRLVQAPPDATPPQVQQAAALSHLVLVLGAGAALVALLLGGWLPRRAGAFALALLTLADLLVIARGSIEPRPTEWARGTERFAAVDWLLARHPADRFIPAASGPFRLHNLGMTYGPALEGAGGYDSFAIWRYVNFLWTVNNAAPYPHALLDDDLAAGLISRFDTPLVDFLDVRWAIAPSPPAPHWIERFRLAPDAPVHAVYEPAWDRVLKVYENPRAMPRAFVVYDATVVPGDREQLQAVATLDPARNVILDSQPPVRPAGDGRPLTPAAHVAFSRQTFAADVDIAAPGILVMSEPAYPGWTATDNGEPVPILRANYAFRAIALAPGRHHVEMRFRSRPTQTGLMLSAFGLVALAALAVTKRTSIASERS